MRTRACSLRVAAVLSVAWAGFIAPAWAQTRPSAAQPIQTHSGPVTGKDVGEVRAYLGIPYAAPPVGPLRWKPPVDPAPWTAPRACRAFGRACPQPTRRGVQTPTDQNEDCLTLNVWTAARAGDKLPVMVWIHGGGFYVGSSSQDLYDGAALAKRGVVVVSINYRLGVLGFLAHPDLTAESSDKSSGNYGLRDQIFALEWVRKNIAAFGGDGGCVTIFGESAGGVSVCCLLSSPLAKGLFHRAIAQSGPAPSRLNDLRAAERHGEEFAARLAGKGRKPASLEAMRSARWPDLQAAAGEVGPGPGQGTLRFLCVDGAVLPDSPAAIFTAARQANVPLLIGATTDEGATFAPLLGVRGQAGLRMMLALAMPGRADEAMRFYGVTDDESARQAVAQIIGDAFVCGARLGAAAHAKVQPQTYLYSFARVTPWARRRGLGAFHGSELPYVFGRLPAMLYDASDRKLSERMMAYWVNFARSGDPNAPGLPNWPAYEPDGDRHLVFDVEIHADTALRKAQCEFWRETLAK